MAYLINRTPPARLRCLHSLLKLAFAKFGFESFYMWDLLFNKLEHNIHNHCNLLKYDKNLGIKYCPFFLNPLSNAGCYLTRWVEDDTTKRKEISNSVNSLDALWFINRTWRKLFITDLWMRFSCVEFESCEWLEIAKEAVCNYWLAVSLLYQISALDNSFQLSDLKMHWYPNTNEFISKKDENIEISSGSKTDSNTRTKSCLIAWFTTVGYIIPNSIKDNVKLENSHIDTNDYIINTSIRNESKYSIWCIPKIFWQRFIVKKPLDYKNLTKDSKALRENWQALSRQQTMEYTDIIRNRRFAIVYILHKSFIKDCLLNFENLIKELSKFPKFFIINIDEFYSVMHIELWIAQMCWITFEVIDWKYLKPLTWVDLEVLTQDAPLDVLNILDNWINKNVYEM